MKYDTNEYTALGVGERLTADTLWVDTTLDRLWPITQAQIGLVVDEDISITYVRKIAKAPIAKVAFASGATRSDPSGRGRFDLIPYEAMRSLAQRYEMGAATFGERNWERGQPLSRLLSSMRRHSHQIGYDYTEDHCGAVLWNAAAFVTMVERMRAGILPKELDDVGYFINEEATKQ